MALRKKRAPKAQEKTTTKATKKTTDQKSEKKKPVAKKAAKRGRPKKVLEPVEPVEQELEQEDTQQEEIVSSDPLFVQRPAQWILIKTMQFGIINESFPVGTVFTVDWANRRMRSEGNGRVYENIKDLEIAIKIGTVEPYANDGSTEQYEQQQFIEAEARVNKNRQMSDGRRTRDEEVRDMVSRSDQDIVQSIDISETHRPRRATPTPINVTPSSEVTINKPRQPNQMEVHYSDSPQNGQIVRASNKPIVRNEVQQTRTGAKPLSPVLADKHYWDASKSEGEIRNDINRKMADYSIKVDANGQQFIRGLPIIRDDSEASGPSMNAGSVISLTKEQLTQRAGRIAQIKAEKQAEVASNRQAGGQSVVDNSVIVNQAANMMPQEVVPGVGYDDSGITPIEHVVQPETPTVKKNSTAGKLLRRR